VLRLTSRSGGSTAEGVGRARSAGPLRCPPVPRPPLLLLPPSEGKATGGRLPARPGSFDEALAHPRSVVLEELGRLLRSPGHAWQSRVFGARGELLDRAVAATHALVVGAAPILPAWRRYTGVVWAALDPGTLSAAGRRRLLVPSGLYGITSADDPVADYRLKLLVSLGHLGRLSTFWRPEVTTALAARARGRVVVDLLPAEHAHAVDLGALARVARVVRVRFVTADGTRALGHDAKSAKGHLARSLLDHGLDGVSGFRCGGWRATVEGDRVTVVAPER
jgi:uncharacterized protein